MRTRNHFLTVASVIALAISFVGCATPASRPQPLATNDTLDAAQAQDSAVHITYVLGHDQYRFAVEAKQDLPFAQSFVDREVLEQGKVDQRRYMDFLQKANRFISDPKRALAQKEDNCRTPFTVAVRIGKDTRTASGCRGADEGALSRLVKDGEFLLFSKK